MKFPSLAPVMLITLGTLTACGGDSKSPVVVKDTVTPVIKDTVAPVITLNGSSTFIHSAGTPYVDLGAVATDNIIDKNNL